MTCQIKKNKSQSDLESSMGRKLTESESMVFTYAYQKSIENTVSEKRTT